MRVVSEPLMFDFNDAGAAYHTYEDTKEGTPTTYRLVAHVEGAAITLASDKDPSVVKRMLKSIRFAREEGIRTHEIT